MPRPPQGPPDWMYDMPGGPGGFGNSPDPGGFQPTDQFGYPINPGFSPAPSPPPSMGDYTSPTGITPEPDTLPGIPPPGGWPIDVQVPTAPPSSGGSSPTSPTNNFNYYDAGNGVTYVYDQDWNYVGTTGGSQAPTSPSGGNVPPPSMPWYAGAGPLPGGNQNPGNPGYVAPRATTNDVYTPGQSGWEGTGSNFNFLVPGGVTAKNI